MDFVRRILTKRVRRGKRLISLEPPRELVNVMRFALAMTACLTGLECVSVVFLGKWNSDAIAVIASLVGMVTGILVGSKA